MPCPICGQGKGCRLWEDGTVECLRIGSSDEVQGGLGGWRHRPQDYRPGPQQVYHFAAPTPERAAPADLDRVYRRLGQDMPLSADHRAHLTGPGRQLTPEQLTRRGYFSWDWGERHLRRQEAQQLYEVFGSLVLSVPGFVLRRQSGQDKEYLTLSGAPGIFLPVRDPDQQLVGAQLRWDRPREGSGKYGWLSSSSRGGPGAGTPIHVARPLARPQGTGEVWITEGILKADIACDRLGVIVCSLPGVNAWRAGLVPTLERLRERGELTSVVLALDSDHREKPAVAQARKAIAEHLARSGFPVELADWTPQCKGLDDLLLAGGRPRREPYQVHGAGVRPLQRQAEAPPTPPVPPSPLYSLAQARDLLLSQLVERLTNPGGRFSQTGLLIRTPPGSGKSTILTRAVNQVLENKKSASTAIFVSRHNLAKDDPGRASWGHVTGRTWTELDDQGQAVRRPCHLADRQLELARLRIPAQLGCERCPLHDACQQNRARRPEAPYYFAQFAQKKRATVYPAQHFLTSSLWSHHASVVLDDVALVDLALETVEIQRADVLRALEWAQRDLDQVGEAHHTLGPAQPLLKILADWLREAEDQKQSFSGPAFFAELERQARDCGFGLRELLEQAQTAKEPPPFLGKTLAQGLRPVPPRFLADLVEVLLEECQRYENQEERWNRRVYLERSPARPERFALRLLLRRALPLVALEGKPLIVTDASATLEELQQLFPQRSWSELWVRLDMPKTVEILQDPRRRWGKTSLQDPLIRAAALEEIAQVLKKHPRQKVGLITHQSFEGHVQRRFPQLKTAHFYGQRGSNEFADYDVLIVLGTPSPNPQALVQQAEALFHRQEPLALAEYLQPRSLQTGPGESWSVAVRTYQDPRLQALLRSKREEELLQAVYRVRPLSVQPAQQGQLGLFPEELELQEPRLGCTIYCFTNQPLEGLTVKLSPPVVESSPVALEPLQQALEKAASWENGRRRKPTQGELAQVISLPVRRLRLIELQLHALWLSLARNDFLAVEAPALPTPPTAIMSPAPRQSDTRQEIWSRLQAHRKEPPGEAAAAFS